MDKITMAGLFFVAIAIIGLITYEIVKISNRKRKLAYEKEQIDKGLIKFIDRFGREHWGNPEEISLLAVRDTEFKEKEREVNQIADIISQFTPSRKYEDEFSYQNELYNFLRSHLKSVKIEESRGSSRPDITVGEVAIEIKGPTETKDLQTIADKCMRYVQHFEELIIVLFDVRVYENRYKEWEKGIKKSFPSILIIKKE